MNMQPCCDCGREFTKKALKDGRCPRCLETVQNKRAYRDLYDRIVALVHSVGAPHYPTEEEARRITEEVLELFE